MSTRFLKCNIDGVCVPQFQLDYFRDTTHTSHKNLFKLCCELHYMWWGNQYLELQELGDCVDPNQQESYLLLCKLQKTSVPDYPRL